MILAGAAALPALAIPAVAIEADAEIFALERKIQAMHARLRPLEVQQEAAHKRYKAALPPERETQKLPAEFEGWEKLTLGEIGELALDQPDHPFLALLRLGRKNRPVVPDTWYEEGERLREESGYNAVQQQYNDLCGEIWDTSMELLAIPAHTIAGVAAKVRTAKYMAAEDGDERIWRAITSDIRVLAGEIQPPHRYKLDDDEADTVQS
jgi:hypothetical protein